MIDGIIGSREIDENCISDEFLFKTIFYVLCEV